MRFTSFVRWYKAKVEPTKILYSIKIGSIFVPSIQGNQFFQCAAQGTTEGAEIF